MLEPTPDLVRRVMKLLIERCTVMESGCWIYDSAEYPTIAIDGKSARFSRVVYTLMVGVIPDSYDVDHECHNRDLTCPGGPTCAHRRCLNPDHLRARTHADNVRSARRTERATPPSRAPRRRRHPVRIAGRARSATPLRPATDPARPWIATRDLAGLLGMDGRTAAVVLGQRIHRELRVRATEPRDMPDGSRARGYYVDDVRSLLPLDGYTPGV